MVQSDPDERLVYLACQHIFHGSNSLVRKRKNIKSLIQQNQPALTDILREYSIDRTCNVAKKLLVDQVFHSNLRAKIRFPELFEVSPAQSAEREASEAEAARDEANAVRKISEREVSRAVTAEAQTQLANEEHRKFDVSAAMIGTSTPVPSLYPVYIHYRSQHIITTSIQRLVEEGCFAYAQKKFPQLLAKNGWDCSEAVELTEWTKLLPQYFNEPVSTKKPRDELFNHLRELRHSAVHRLQKTAVGVERLAENAQLFLEALNDSHRSMRVSMVRRELNMAIEELKRNKDLLEGRYLAELKEIQTERAALDSREQNAKNAMLDGDLQCLNDIDKSLESVVQYCNADESIREEGKGKMPMERPELSDSEEEFLESMVAVHSPDCATNQL
ncbi:hypothetical protein BJY04DRAFT_221324 [Aspergillus karnatakaensis]|uniref:uncharacterized protein n=1 Tax=Aspergillus karnatakaensis TaxID=1810916 RepID=UPI003CCD997A